MKIQIKYEYYIPNGPDDFDREESEQEFDSIEKAEEFLKALSQYDQDSRYKRGISGSNSTE